MVASIPFIERIIETYAQATAVNLHAPGRQNSVVVVTPELADEVMITGDLHGNRRNFNLIRRIADLARHPRRQLILQEVCHGGPVYPQNGGCMSHAMLEDVAKLIVQFPGQVHFILGNHELAELTEYPIQKNKQMLNLMFRLGLQHMYGPATEKVREAYLPFLESCPLAVRLPGGVFVSHSVPEKADTDRFDKTDFHSPARLDGILRPLEHFRPGLGTRLPSGECPGVCREGRRPGVGQRSRALRRGLQRAERQADHSGLLRRASPVRHVADAGRVDPSRDRRADREVGLGRS